MPGAFAHITAVNLASSNSDLMKLDMPKKAKLILSTEKRFMELGCVSPDYPYLKLGDSKQNEWADRMHYSNVDVLIKKLIHLTRELSGEAQGIAFAWLSGYVAHVICDITIHPVVQLRVGPYEQNKKEHRICEMNQDSHIWKRLNLGDIGLADRVRLNIGSCTSSVKANQLESVIHDLWLNALEYTFPDECNKTPPQIHYWHRGFLRIVDNVDEGYRLFPFARHVAASAGIVYPAPDDIDMSYIKNLDTPLGTRNYDEVFDLAIENVQKYWCILAKAIYEEGDDSMFLSWNLDTGFCENNALTAWI
jgi:hypothetical protein